MLKAAEEAGKGEEEGKLEKRVEETRSFKVETTNDQRESIQDCQRKMKKETEIAQRKKASKLSHPAEKKRCLSILR